MTSSSFAGQFWRYSASYFDRALLCRYMCRGTFVLYKERNEFRRLRITCVTAKYMDIVGTFIETLPSSEDHFLLTAYLHDDGPLQYVDKHLSVMAMYGFRTAWRIFNTDHRAFFALGLGEIPRQQVRHRYPLREEPVGSGAGYAQDQLCDLHHSSPSIVTRPMPCVAPVIRTFLSVRSFTIFPLSSGF